jgi:predicted small lipoprotein YifL
MKKLAITILFLLLAACGKKGPLIPPEAGAPAPVADLATCQKGERFFVSWSAPSHDEAGRTMTDLAGFRLYRREVLPTAEDCEECPNAYRLLATVDLDFVQGVFIHNNRYYYLDDTVTTGVTYQYRVVTFRRDGSSSAPSKPIRRRRLAVPLAPTLELKETPTSILLSWSAPPVESGAALAGFNLYRREKAAGYFPPEPLATLPATAASYEDLSLERGVSYVYGLRLVTLHEGEQVESPLSPPRDGLLP